MLEDVDGSLQDRPGPVQLTLGVEHVPEVVQTGGHLGMVRTESGLEDVDGSLQDRPGRVQLTLGVEHVPEVVQTGGHLGMVRTESGLEDGKATLEGFPGGRQLLQVVQHLADGDEAVTSGGTAVFRAAERRKGDVGGHRAGRLLVEIVGFGALHDRRQGAGRGASDEDGDDRPLGLLVDRLLDEPLALPQLRSGHRLSTTTTDAGT